MQAVVGMIAAEVTEHAGQRIAVGVVWWGTPESTANDYGPELFLPGLLPGWQWLLEGLLDAPGPWNQQD